MSITEQLCVIFLWSSKKILLITLCDNFLIRTCWWSGSSMIFCVSGKDFLWVKKIVKVYCNVYIDLDTIYSCLYYIFLFWHNLFMTKLLCGVSGRWKRGFLVIVNPLQKPTQKHILILKSFTSVRRNSERKKKQLWQI